MSILSFERSLVFFIPTDRRTDHLPCHVDRYVPQLQGVLITHDFQDGFQSTQARIEGDCPYAVVHVGLPCLTWSPRIGNRLEGKISHSFPSHVSLVVDKTFNASVTAAHLGKHWEFVVDEQMENERLERVDSETEAEEADGDLNGESLKAADEDDQEEDGAARSRGYWRNKKNGTRLGDESGIIMFTVISMTIDASDTLSLHGSMLKKPFSVPPPSRTETDDAARSALSLFGASGATSISTTAPRTNAAGRLSLHASSATTAATTGSAAVAAAKRVRWRDEAGQGGLDEAQGDDDEENDDDEDESRRSSDVRAYRPASGSSRLAPGGSRAKAARTP